MTQLTLPPPFPLAAPTENEYVTVIVWCLVIIGCVIATFFLATLLRRRYMARVDDVPAAGFTLSELRRLHEGGQMSTEEFEKARVAMIEATKRADERKKAEQQKASADPLQLAIEAERARSRRPPEASGASGKAEDVE